MKKFLAIPAALALFTACEKEIEMSYIPVDKLYVVEGYVSDEGIEVAVSTTRNMEDGNRKTGISGAVVEISGTDGYREMLRHEGDGRYRSPSAADGSPGTVYTMTVTAGGREFVSTSEMTAPGEISAVRFSYEPAITGRYMFCSVNIADPPGTENRYCLRIFKNGEVYSRTLITDKGHDGGVIPNTLLIRFSWDEEPTPEEIANGNADKMFRKGDRLDMRLETVDRPVYDYLYSLGLSSGSLSNPLTNIEGGCLGYFRAYSSHTYETVFDPEEIAPKPKQP